MLRLVPDADRVTDGKISPPLNGFGVENRKVTLKCHETKLEKDCLPKVGRWNMINKVGGRNIELVDAISWFLPLVGECATTIFSADVTHPHPGEHSCPSIATVSS
ncbi:Protein argonaute 1 [Platanthera guangdongensis]|uniref:Protein argonaute 1 n=1 Tax=Platanthera guangdongensis TaxID=2320717 RepID=A0ABR2LJ99_9ASPA